MPGPSDYDKMKEMYRLQGQDEQAKRFRAMTGMPEMQEAPAAPGPMEGLEPSPIMQASIAKDKADRVAASERYGAAEQAADTAKFGPKGAQGYGEISPESFLGKYDVLPYAHEFSILKTLEDRGYVTLSPELKRDIAKVQRTEARESKAYADMAKLEKSQEVGIYERGPRAMARAGLPTSTEGYVQTGTYDPYK